MIVHLLEWAVSTGGNDKWYYFFYTVKLVNLPCTYLTTYYNMNGTGFILFVNTAGK